MIKCYIYSIGNPFVNRGDTLWGYTSSRKKAKCLCRQLNMPCYADEAYYYTTNKGRPVPDYIETTLPCLDRLVSTRKNKLCGDCRHYYYDKEKDNGFCRKKKGERWWVQETCSRFKKLDKSVDIGGYTSDCSTR